MSEETTKNEAFEQENIDENATETNQENVTTEEKTDNKSEDTLVTPEAQLSALNDKYLRLYSEFDNYRKRTNKERLDLISTASSGVLKDLLTVLDDFDRAILNNEKAEDINAVKEGFSLISSKLKGILDGKGLKAMECKGEVFNPELHEAVANFPAPEEDLKGKIIDVAEKGYYLNDKVIRFAKVIVGQ